MIAENAVEKMIETFVVSLEESLSFILCEGPSRD